MEHGGSHGSRDGLATVGGAPLDSWRHVLVLLRQLNEQLRWGARVELLPLLEPKLPTMTVRLASVLYAYSSAHVCHWPLTLNALTTPLDGRHACGRVPYVLHCE